VPPKVSTSEKGSSDAISSAARQAMALIGNDGSTLLPPNKLLNLIPPGLPVMIEIG